ncbi:GTP diphosphokinase [Saccharospirillum sp. MSK14-1]|uniref:GTP diphosphokinase n=1 Tax=Saccharospirillum sp. MSK14-1 TaxID=1897632 RepID=UPI000D380D8F|nr:GTP diphosphokinase [Saccharospirillum sp. MSK14-1]PTY38912.1 GTP diphosphokinase [Saccharospirillum sp. MSK14-1]
MVKVREDQPVFSDGTVDLESWLDRIENKAPLIDSDELVRACRIARLAEQEADEKKNHWGEGESAYRTGLEMAEILADLNLDQEALIAAILYRTVREEELPLDTVRDQFGPQVASLIEGVLRMAAIHTQHKSTRASVLGSNETQGEAVRKMLVAMIDDVRVALIKLAERTCAIRAVKHAPAARKYKVAREVSDIYAPLAHRLGVGQLKWELEDLSFRYLEPQDYKKIAKLLDEKRLDRQHYIENVQSILQAEVEAAGIQSEIQGRAKHIYSIWRKMKRKSISFSQVYDIRAFRVLVPDVRDCYTVLGIVHSLWRHIPREFDDYIASPKSNGYRSLHTAVIGPEGKVVEVQIRTHAMHEDAELGVCAHWVYKGTDAKGNTHSRGYEEKVNWLRQVLEWHDELGGIEEMVEELGSDVETDRIYVLTPEGHVVDLGRGATPIDFAYKIHTDVGNRCRGAKVNGRIVPLNHQLKIGDQVSVLTGREPSPSRDWLNPDLGYVHSNRARAKIRHWFKSLDRDQNLAEGRAMLMRELQRFNLPKLDMDEVAVLVNYNNADDMYAAIGAGDLRLMQVVHVAESLANPDQPDEIQLGEVTEHKSSGDLVIHGVGNMLTSIANCCKPVPGDPVVGFITMGRGVSIHRQDCVNLLQLKSREPERIIEVSWGGRSRRTYPVDITILAYDRTGLLRDIMMVMANASLNVTSVNTLSNKDESQADMKLTLEIEDIDALGKVMAQLSKIPNVADVRRAFHQPH